MDVPDHELTALVLAAQQGDAAGRDALIRLVRPAVLRYVLARGVGDHDAEDLTQDVCVAVLDAVSRYRDQGRPIWALVFTIVRNKLADRARRQVRRNESLCADMTALDRAAHPSPAELMEQEESAREVGVLLGELPATQRDVLLLRVIVGLSAAETAEALGLTVGSVRVIQYRGMTALRSWLRESSEATAS